MWTQQSARRDWKSGAFLKRCKIYSIHTGIIELGKPSANVVTWKLAVFTPVACACLDGIMVWYLLLPAWRLSTLLDHIPILLYRRGDEKHLLLAASALCSINGIQLKPGNHGFETRHRHNMCHKHLWADPASQSGLVSAHSPGADAVTYWQWRLCRKSCRLP